MALPKRILNFLEKNGLKILEINGDEVVFSHHGHKYLIRSNKRKNIQFYEVYKDGVFVTEFRRCTDVCSFLLRELGVKPKVNYTDSPETISVRVTPILYNCIQVLIELGLFSSVSEALREAIRLLIREYSEILKTFAPEIASVVSTKTKET